MHEQSRATFNTQTSNAINFNVSPYDCSYSSSFRAVVRQTKFFDACSNPLSYAYLSYLQEKETPSIVYIKSKYFSYKTHMQERETRSIHSNFFSCAVATYMQERTKALGRTNKTHKICSQKYKHRHRHGTDHHHQSRPPRARAKLPAHHTRAAGLDDRGSTSNTTQQRTGETRTKRAKGPHFSLTYVKSPQIRNNHTQNKSGNLREKRRLEAKRARFTPWRSLPLLLRLPLYRR